MKSKPKRAQTPVHAKRSTRADKADQKGKINMQHGLENTTRKVVIKWSESDTHFDAFYYPVQLIYGSWIATKNGEAFTAQDICEAEDNLLLYCPDEEFKRCNKELSDWKETVRLAKNVILEGCAAELDGNDDNYIMNVLYERGYLK